MLGYVIDEVRRIETLVRDFLDFAQPKAPVTTELPMRAIIDRVAAIAAPELSRRKVSVAVMDESGGAAILGDPDQLHQACLNLVLNAIDAMPEGGTIHASVTATEGCVSLTIRDEGRAFPRRSASRSSIRSSPPRQGHGARARQVCRRWRNRMAAAPPAPASREEELRLR